MTHPSLPKPRTEYSLPELVSLPRLTRGRRLARRFFNWMIRLIVWLFADIRVSGIENVPARGPVLVVSNHLGDADTFIGLALSPLQAEVVAKIELHEIPVLGALMNVYGVIWIHRGQADRKAIRAIQEALAEGRMVALAPEGRESVTGELEEGTEGAAYLAVKADVPILPVTFTGTRNSQVYANLKRLRRSRITMTVGQTFRLPREDDWHESVRQGTQIIMETLAGQLPNEYQGVYKV
jgi:1-acyl-sn-glycerol-3-phosphate acyltransferase